jgi:hypothetical protein
MEDTSFMCCSDSNTLNITEDIFRMTKRIREVDVIDNDDKDTIEIRFDIQGSGRPKTSFPIKTTVFKLDGTASSITSVSPNGVIYEVEGNESPPSFIPYNSIPRKTRRIQRHKVGSGVHNTPEDVQELKTPEHVTWGLESPKAP